MCSHAIESLDNGLKYCDMYPNQCKQCDGDDGICGGNDSEE